MRGVKKNNRKTKRFVVKKSETFDKQFHDLVTPKVKAPKGRCIHTHYGAKVHVQNGAVWHVAHVACMAPNDQQRLAHLV
jgi:hypothetical protein